MLQKDDALLTIKGINSQWNGDLIDTRIINKVAYSFSGPPTTKSTLIDFRQQLQRIVDSFGAFVAAAWTTQWHGLMLRPLSLCPERTGHDYSLWWGVAKAGNSIGQRSGTFSSSQRSL